MHTFKNITISNIMRGPTTPSDGLFVDSVDQVFNMNDIRIVGGGFSSMNLCTP